MTISQEAIEAFALAFWPVNAVSKMESCSGDIAKALEAALPFLPIAGEGKVKQLEWLPISFGDEVANTILGTYTITGGETFFVWFAGQDDDEDYSVAAPTMEAAKAAAQSDFNTRILSALISSPGKDGWQEVEAVGELREALQRLEDCCDQLAGTRSREVYDAMINSGQAEALIDLDNARLNAREVLSRPSPYPVPDTVAVVTGDAALALGLPEGTKLYTRPHPASTALVERRIAAIIAANVQSVCDWDDRTSPDDYPDHLLITPAELTELLEGVVDAALSVPAAAVVGEPVAWAFRNNGDDMWLFARDEPEICYEKQPLYAAPFNQRTEVEPAWWIVTTDMGKVIFHGPDKDRADRVAAIHGREAQPLYAAHPWPDGYVRGHLHLIRCFADDMTERNWEDKRLYIKQQVDFIVSALGGASHD